MWTPALRRGWKTEGEEGVYHESKESDQKGGLSFNTAVTAAADAAKSLQLCPTLCDPIDGSPNRLRRPWDFPGKNTGVGCHFLLQCMKVKSQSEVAQSCPTLCDPTDCSLLGSSVHGIFQARVLEWVAIAFSQHIWGLAVPQTSRNYLHLSISESDLHLLGIATDEWLKLWSSPSRPGEYTYKCKRYRKQKHINGVPQTENTFWKQWDKDHIVTKDR